LSQISEKELIELCQKQDRRAQQKLYQAYKDSLFTLAIRLVKDKELAGVILQDAFIEIFKSIKRYRGDSGVFAWMRIILVRCAYRNKGIYFDDTESLSELEEYEDISAPDAEAIDLKSAFDELSSGYRAALTLYYLEEMSHLEIAELLNISIGTSKSQLHHARKKLKRILENRNV
jgi:RNA polymerase sigma-70 factor (ECF subfamily)